ncbi:hypothetical protein OG992_08270 [Micromonospora sp. NBC_00362]|uniref:hypothetical protein n=2 Tax=unclassified Micromonospora TaxID=2617518 RepID=UPI0022528C23|nr:hypothetical protein [Micromonospora sp. NBC_00362]MCX5117174.1 hypothetical protein [Micromonospora sp. NBC_00362]
MKAGDVVLIGAACSVQFSGDRALMLRLVSIGETDPYNDWIWITGYVLDTKGLATAKRELYVLRAGLRIRRRTAPASAQPRRSGSRVMA